MHESSGGPEKGISLRGLRAGLTRRGDLLFTGRIVQGDSGQPADVPDLHPKPRSNKAVQLPTPIEFATFSTAPAGRCALQESEVGSRAREDAGITETMRPMRQVPNQGNRWLMIHSFPTCSPGGN